MRGDVRLLRQAVDWVLVAARGGRWCADASRVRAVRWERRRLAPALWDLDAIDFHVCPWLAEALARLPALAAYDPSAVEGAMWALSSSSNRRAGAWYPGWAAVGAPVLDAAAAAPDPEAVAATSESPDYAPTPGLARAWAACAAARARMQRRVVQALLVSSTSWTT